MVRTRVLTLLSSSLLTALTVANPVSPIQGRGFIGVQNGNSVHVDDLTAATLKSGVTTVFLPIIYIIVFCVGLPSNAMALWVFIFRSKKIHPAAIYMANLALSDLLFMVWLPLKISYHINGNHWTFGEGLCKVLVGFFYGNMYGSILFIMCLSVQRYWVVAHPLTQQRTNNTLAIIVSICIWIFIVVSSTPLFLYQHTAQLSDPEITTCHDVNIITKEHFNTKQTYLDVKEPYYYFMVMAGLAFCAPCVVIVTAYVLMLRKLHNSTVDGSSAGKNRRRAVVLIVTVLITFLVCFIPSNVMLLVHYSLLWRGMANNGYGFYITTLCLTSLNSCLDPFVYYYVSEDFRNHVKNTLKCRSIRTVDRETVSFSSMKYSKKTNTYTNTSTC